MHFVVINPWINPPSKVITPGLGHCILRGPDKSYNACQAQQMTWNWIGNMHEPLSFVTTPHDNRKTVHSTVWKIKSHFQLNATVDNSFREANKLDIEHTERLFILINWFFVPTVNNKDSYFEYMQWFSPFICKRDCNCHLWTFGYLIESIIKYVHSV